MSMQKTISCREKLYYRVDTCGLYGTRSLFTSTSYMYNCTACDDETHNIESSAYQSVDLIVG